MPNDHQLPWFLQLLLDLATFRRNPITYITMGAFVLVVCLHIAWACGWLVTFGLDGGFEKVSDSERMERAVNWGLKLQVTREVREVTASYCRSTDESDRYALQNYIGSLLDGYEKATNTTMVMPPCAVATSVAPPPISPPKTTPQQQ